MTAAFPLERMGEFKIPMVEPLSLPVTSVVLETRPEMMGRIRAITEWHRKWFRFAREVIVSVSDPQIPGTFFCPCPAPPLGEMAALWYSDFCVKWVDRLCDSDFVLLWQWDGFIVNPELWTGEFMRYDYVGAPVVSDYWRASCEWLVVNKPGWRIPPNLEYPIVGNGGFSLRSKRFVSTTAGIPIGTGSWLARNEDQYLCLEMREELENGGIKFCSPSLAKRFSKDEGDTRPIGECFGFHDVTHMQEVKEALESKYVGVGT